MSENDALPAYAKQQGYVLDNLPRLSEHLIRNAREPYDKWASGFCTDVEGFILAQQEEINRLRKGIWDMVYAMGYDQGRSDGAEHFHLTYPDIVKYGLEATQNFREDYDHILESSGDVVAKRD